MTMILLVLLNVFPFTPRYIIPIAGMMVGNAMAVTGVTMKRLREDLKIQLNLVSIQAFKLFFYYSFLILTVIKS